MIIPPDFTSRETWIAAGPWIVGATFVWASGIKAIAPHVFQEHLSKLGWIPPRLLGNSVVAAAGLEAGWGTALILGVAPAILLPATAVLLAAFTAVSWWGVKSGRTTDCGCYGGFVVPSIGQSVLLNGGFAALALVAWLVAPPLSGTAPWKLVVTGAIAAAFTGVALASQRFLHKHGRLMVDTSPLKVGRRWHSRWGVKVPDDGRELLVSYLGPDCPYCKQWVRVLNAMDQAEGLPRVMGIVATSKEKLETFIETSGIRFPVTTIPQTLMSRLVWGVPTTALVASGMIEKTWGGQMPPDFFHRFRKTFFPLPDAPAQLSATEETTVGSQV
jgi:hypothetical protein